MCLVLSKLGRKFCCKFNRDVGCHGLVSGKKVCIADVTGEEQFYEKHEVEHVFCPLLPDSEKVEFFAILKEQGFSFVRRWYE